MTGAAPAAPLVLRRAGAADVALARDLEVACFGTEAWSEETLLGELVAEDRRAVIAASAEGPVGYAVARLSDVVDLHRICVLPARRGSGAATQLLGAVLRNAPVAMLEVAESNARARAFYRRQGFREVARRPRYYRDGSAAVVMRREVGS